MTYEEAKAMCTKAFAKAERRVGSNKEAIALEVAVMAAGDKALMDALFIVAMHKDFPGKDPARN
jgi:hypothetical protein